jgi:hypothetical protein
LKQKAIQDGADDLDLSVIMRRLKMAIDLVKEEVLELNLVSKTIKL